MQIPELSIVFRFDQLMDKKSNFKIWLFGQFTMEIGDFRQNLYGPKHDFLVTESKNVKKQTPIKF